MGSQWPSITARQLKAALKRIGWTGKRDLEGSHLVMRPQGWPDYTFAFHDSEEVGPKILSRVVKKTGLRPSDL